MPGDRLVIAGDRLVISLIRPGDLLVIFLKRALTGLKGPFLVKIPGDNITW